MLKEIYSFAKRLFREKSFREVSQELLFPDERSCAISVLSTATVQGIYRTLEIDPSLIVERLSKLPDRQISAGVMQVLSPGSFWHQQMIGLSGQVPIELCQLVGLLIHGSAATREVLTPPAGKPGDIPFVVAHGRREEELRVTWPAINNQTGDILLINDSFSPMEAVVGALVSSFGMSREQAIAKMLKVHKSGEAALEIHQAATSASELCLQLNNEWRSLGLPLYCKPERMNVSEITSQGAGSAA